MEYPQSPWCCPYKISLENAAKTIWVASSHYKRTLFIFLCKSLWRIYHCCRPYSRIKVCNTSTCNGQGWQGGGHIMRSFSDKGQVCEETCCEIDVVLLMAFPWMDVDMFLRITTIGEAARPSCELGKKFWCRKHGGFCPRSPLADHSVRSTMWPTVTMCTVASRVFWQTTLYALQ